MNNPLIFHLREQYQIAKQAVEYQCPDKKTFCKQQKSLESNDAVALWVIDFLRKNQAVGYSFSYSKIMAHVHYFQLYYTSMSPEEYLKKIQTDMII